jgi:hypothetical protein
MSGVVVPKLSVSDQTNTGATQNDEAGWEAFDIALGKALRLAGKAVDLRERGFTGIVRLSFIEQDKPVQHAYFESVQGRLRDE